MAGVLTLGLMSGTAAAQILEMRDVERLHVLLEDCESEYPLFNPPTQVSCVTARGKLMGHYGSEEALREGAAHLRAAWLARPKSRPAPWQPDENRNPAIGVRAKGAGTDAK